MNRFNTIREELVKYCNIKDSNFTFSGITQFIMDNCYCENCEHNAPNYPWDVEN